MNAKSDNYLYEMVRTELADAVGEDYVNVNEADKFGHSVDYYWIPEMWHDRGMPTKKPDFVVHPGSAEEVAQILKIANQYRIPVTTRGGGALQPGVGRRDPRGDRPRRRHQRAPWCWPQAGPVHEGALRQGVPGARGHQEVPLLLYVPPPVGRRQRDVPRGGRPAHPRVALLGRHPGRDEARRSRFHCDDLFERSLRRRALSLRQPLR